MKPNTLTSSDWNWHDLMRFRIHEILLVASPYDAYILEEDGRLTEQIYQEYIGMNLSSAPRVSQVSTAAEAMEFLSKNRCDLIITMPRLADMDPVAFCRDLRKKHSRKPLIMLAYNMAELEGIPDDLLNTLVDRIFIWSGDASVFPAVIKYVEDIRNSSNDIRNGNVRAIIVVEDNPDYYSMFLPTIYTEIIYHTGQLMDKSLNDAHRLLRMRGRPKILLATTYEEAEKLYQKYRDNLLGVISDIRFPKNGKPDKRAGIKLAKWIRKSDETMPIILQSSQEDMAKQADDIGTYFLNKFSDTFIRELRQVILENFGFGDFVFRNPNGRELQRVTNMYDFQENITAVPDESLKFHASHNHFSNWLAARGEFRAASLLRPLTLADFATVSALREFLIETITESRKDVRRGQIVDYSTDSFDPSTTLVRIGGGSLGGKARGLAYANRLISRSNLQDKFPDVEIRVPNLGVIGTDYFDEFMSMNKLWSYALRAKQDKRVRLKFLSSELPSDLIEVLKNYLQKVKHPLAVRSSGLLEDSKVLSLAGVYSTFMLPNNSSRINDRLEQLVSAIKLIYASMFLQESKALMASLLHNPEQEKMAVIIQELVGEIHGAYFYPTFSGTALSMNYYPISYLKREDGIAHTALGFGKIIMEGDRCLRFSPKYPSILPQFYSPEAMLENSQRYFYALPLDSSEAEMDSDDDDLHKLGLEVAEADGSIRDIASVLTGEDNVLRDSLQYKGPRIITFANILKWKTFPLADMLVELLKLGEEAFGSPIEAEFCVNLKGSKKLPEFCLLQMRPMASEAYRAATDVTDINKDDTICRSSLILGNGIIDDIYDIIFIEPQKFDASRTVDIAREIEKLNEEFKSSQRYVLMGPGRWGSADPWLGIPVNWKQISRAKVIVEAGLENFHIDPSFGSHFFQNVTSLRVGYFTVNPKGKGDSLDWKWLQMQKVHKETTHLKWLKFEEPLAIQMDGRIGAGAIIKP